MTTATMAKFSLSKLDLPDPRPRGFDYHRHRSLLQLQPPSIQPQDLSYEAEKDYRTKRSYEEKLEWHKRHASTLHRLSYDPLPRSIPGPKTVMYGRVSSSIRALTDNTTGTRVEVGSTCLATLDDIANQWYQLNENRLNLPPMEVDRQFCDKDVSRKVPIEKRPQGFLLLRYLMRGDHLIFPAFDRIGCGTNQVLSALNYIFQRGVTIHIVGFPIKETFDPDDPISELILAVMASLAKMEVKSNSRRRKDATAAAKRSGQWNGVQVPFGFTKREIDGEQKIVPSKEEQEVIAECYRCWVSGWSLYELRLALENRGVKRLGKFWNNEQLYNCISHLHEERKRYGS